MANIFICSPIQSTYVRCGLSLAITMPHGGSSYDQHGRHPVYEQHGRFKSNIVGNLLVDNKGEDMRSSTKRASHYKENSTFCYKERLLAYNTIKVFLGAPQQPTGKYKKEIWKLPKE